MVNGEKIILTNSAISAFKSCPKKYFYRYIRELEAIERPEALLLGTAIHDFLEAHYRQRPYNPPTDLTPKSLAILKGGGSITSSRTQKVLYSGKKSLFSILCA